MPLRSISGWLAAAATPTRSALLTRRRPVDYCRVATALCTQPPHQRHSV